MLERVKDFVIRHRLYFRVFRLSQQPTIAVAFLFGALDANFLYLKESLIIGGALTSLSIAFFIVNEYYDSFDTDRFSYRERILPKQLLDKRLLAMAWVFFTALGSTAMLAYGLGWQLLLLIFIGNFYSAPPFRFKAKFLQDGVALAFSYLIIPYSIPFWLHKMPFSEMIQVPFIAIMAFLGVAQGLHLLADLPADKKGGLDSTSTTLGEKKLIRLLNTLLLFGLLGFVYLVYQRTHWWYYPIIPMGFLLYFALGYGRGVIYEEKRMLKAFNFAYRSGIQIGNGLLIYLLIMVWLRANFL